MHCGALSAMLGVPSIAEIAIPVQKLDFDGRNVLQQYMFACHCMFFFFAMRTAKMDVKRDVFAIVK